MARLRVLRASTKAALLVAGGAAVAQAPLRFPTAYAEAPLKDEIPDKKPIYSSYEPSPTTPTLPAADDTPPAALKQPHPTYPTPTDRLAEQVKTARLFLYRQSLSAENGVNDLMTWAFRKETNLANTIASLAPSPESGEQLLPGAIYVLVSTMAGSIVTRNRGIFVRATFPLAVGITAGWMLIPVTMRNTSDLIWEYEKRVPAISETHLQIRDAVQETWKQARTYAQGATRWADDTASETRKKVEDLVSKGK
ncbi:hypothetical protein H2204_002759 [Knufia peltigerae]|uniref:MICOS complex subunit n=1 Tax=Knufia peltigerae TaxID=1002370 RepID=A0AA38YC36_9EURO|nr:hypothetical protein H2204_002759 [Knufia peltigerae]